MRKKLLCYLLCGVLLIGLTACGSTNYSENIKRVQEMESYFYDGTLKDTLEKGLKNISYSEEDTSESGVYYDVTITGKDKKTGKNVKIVYRVRSTSIAFETYELDGDSKGITAFDNYLKSLSE